MSNLSWQPVISLCILAAIPSGVHALDGAVLIDQSRALAGNVTPGDAPGFPVTLSQPGSYRLSGNLTVDAGTTAIQITADSVTLDLNGFAIIGPAVCSGRPAVCPPAGKGIGVLAGNDGVGAPQGVKVLNGSVRGMGEAAILLSGDASSVEMVRAVSNAGGGIIAGSVIRSEASQNGSFGIVAAAVRDCTATQNLGDGILVNAGGVAAGNVSSFNAGYGIGVFYGSASGNSAFLNKGSGISARCPSSLVGNAVVADNALSIETSGPGCAQASNATRP